MIVKYTFGSHWIEIRDTFPTTFRTDTMSTWIKDRMPFQDIVDFYQKMNWKKVISGIDPNDAQTPCKHSYDLSTDTCRWCGADWETLWNMSGFNKPCCGGGFGTIDPLYTNGKWHDSDCAVANSKPLTSDNVNPFDSKPSVPQPKNLGRCTCGSTAVGSDRHSHWCDIK